MDCVEKENYGITPALMFSITVPIVSMTKRAPNKNPSFLGEHDSSERSLRHAVNTMCDAVVSLLDICCLKLKHMIWQVQWERKGGGAYTSPHP